MIAFFFVLNSNFSIVEASLIDDIVNSDTVFNRACAEKCEGHFEYVRFLPDGKGCFYGICNNTASFQPVGEKNFNLENGETFDVPLYKNPDTYILNFNWTKNENNPDQVYITFENSIKYAVNLNNTNGIVFFTVVDVIHKRKNSAKDLKIVFPPVFKSVRASEDVDFYSDGNFHQTIKLKNWEDRKMKKKFLVPDYRYATA